MNAKTAILAQGKWADVTCQKRNLVMCQKEVVWTLKDAVSEIVKLRKQFQTETERLTEELERVSARVIPVGSIYIEYNDQPSPTELWPDLNWTDVTNKFAGLFFRALGGNSER